MPKPKRVQPAQKGAQDIEMSNYEKKRRICMSCFPVLPALRLS